jgi:hypothetical protein
MYFVNIFTTPAGLWLLASLIAAAGLGLVISSARWKSIGRWAGRLLREAATRIFYGLLLLVILISAGWIGDQAENALGLSSGWVSVIALGLAALACGLWKGCDNFGELWLVVRGLMMVTLGLAAVVAAAAGCVAVSVAFPALMFGIAIAVVVFGVVFLVGGELDRWRAHRDANTAALREIADRLGRRPFTKESE